ncbi:hypothetical protein D9615_004917 [Tricholomella constricta]|uniref:Uncharacterized protein n=1 Tax=Tricholomella constricta TaxID=117010 RepID=A0A8H5HGZ2_9AGAR|nr:hypothetical protein D9615_004917 [Tricholomella constricta]
MSTPSPESQQTAEQITHERVAAAFIALQLIGGCGLLIVVLTAMLGRGVKRYSTWYNFIASWRTVPKPDFVLCVIQAALIYAAPTFQLDLVRIWTCRGFRRPKAAENPPLLLFFGGSLNGPQPPYTLCLIQGIMIYAAPLLTAGTTLALTVQIWFLVRPVVTSASSKTGRIPPVLLTVLLIFPYILYVAFLVGTLVVGWRDPRTVRRVGSGMYCSFANKIPGRLTTGLVLLIMVPCVVLEILICKALRLQWAFFKRQPDALSMALRVVAFTFVGILSIALSVVFFFMIRHGSELNIVISILPVSAVLIFGTQPDLLRVWMFWKERPPPVPEKDVQVMKFDKMPAIIDIHA